jgi:catechol 2,3-dioxygenase-like lactoylglutathione lyase family enzyme
VTVKRIVANLIAADPAAAQAFYVNVFGLDSLMDLGWVVTVGVENVQSVQLNLCSEGGSGTPVPSLSIEVDDLDVVHLRAIATGATIVHGPVREPWGVTRFFLRDPFGNLVNVLQHTS